MESVTAMIMGAFSKATLLGTRVHDGARPCAVWAEIRWDGKRLSISGVEGPRRNGNCEGSCGQIDFIVDQPGPGRDIERFRAVHARWHLNDMRAGTPAQEAWLREHPVEWRYPQSHYTEASKALAAAGLNPDNGYRYGSAWLHEDVPADVIEFLAALPDNTDSYPWHL